MMLGPLLSSSVSFIMGKVLLAYTARTVLLLLAKHVGVKLCASLKIISVYVLKLLLH